MKRNRLDDSTAYNRQAAFTTWYFYGDDCFARRIPIGDDGAPVFRSRSEFEPARQRPTSVPQLRLAGIACRYNAVSGLLRKPRGERCMMRPGSFAESVRETRLGEANAVFTIGHEGREIASTAAGTLTLSEDARGVFFSATVDDDEEIRACFRGVNSVGISFGANFFDRVMVGATNVVWLAELTEISIVEEPSVRGCSCWVAA